MHADYYFYSNEFTGLHISRLLLTWVSEWKYIGLIATPCIHETQFCSHSNLLSCWYRGFRRQTPRRAARHYAIDSRWSSPNCHGCDCCSRPRGWRPLATVKMVGRQLKWVPNNFWTPPFQNRSKRRAMRGRQALSNSETPKRRTNGQFNCQCTGSFRLAPDSG